MNLAKKVLATITVYVVGVFVAFVVALTLWLLTGFLPEPYDRLGMSEVFYPFIFWAVLLGAPLIPAWSVWKHEAPKHVA
jgi:hypothetical protein